MPGIRRDLRYFTVSSVVLLVLLALTFSTSARANPRYASIVVDVASGEVLHAANADATRYPASLTKMMTLYLLFEALEEGRIMLDQPLHVSSYAASKPASKLWLPAGSTITVREAIPALIIRSANDVAVVVAEALGGSESGFAQQMNAKARQLGMTATQFRNASGLPDGGQTSTARDMATLGIHLMNDYPAYYHHFANTSFSYGGKIYNGHNRLLTNYDGADGLKTGYINASGFNVATSAVRDGRRIVAVVMGGFTAQSRDAHMADLLDRGFARASMLGGSDWVAKADVTGGDEPIQAASPATQAQPDRIAELAHASSASQTHGSDRVSEEQQAPAFEGTFLAAAQTVSLDASASMSDAAGEMSSDDPILALMNGFEQEMGGDWSVQIGAFHDPDQARMLADRAADYLQQEQLRARINVTESPERQVFRARLVDMEETQARSACNRLQQQGMDCLVTR